MNEIKNFYTSRFSGIYGILNNITKKYYVGKSINIGSRLFSHRWMLRNNKHYSVYLQNSWNLHSEKNFKFYLLEEVNSNFVIRKNHWIDKFDSIKSGYNSVRAGNNNQHGVNKKNIISEDIIESWIYQFFAEYNYFPTSKDFNFCTGQTWQSERQELRARTC